MPSVRTLLRDLDSRPAPERTLALLETLAATARSAADLTALHERLLFYKAYPRSRAIYTFCKRELEGFAARVAALPGDERAALAQTGIAGTHLYYPYDEHMVRWLRPQVQDRIEVDWEAYAERDTDPLSALTPLMISRAEQDAADDLEIEVREQIEAARGAAHPTALGWLLERLERLVDEPLRQKTYNDLELALDVELVPGSPARSTLDDGPPPRLFVWDPAAARAPFDLISEIRRPLRLPPPVEPRRGRELLDLCYGALLPRLRELYPAIHGNPAEVYDIPLERGIRVILWFMQPVFRLPLEAGWAILLLKNHVPIGYGAGAMLDDRSEIAINVFDTFRGGEAEWLYAQYARIFYALGKAPWLVTRKYQVGYQNEEGLGSGSFWFYDKLGFRSVDAEIRELADAERARIRKEAGYRTPKRILRKLSRADVVLSLAGRPAAEYREFPLGRTGMAAGRVIAEQFEGDRQGLEMRVLRVLRERLGWQSGRLPAAEKAAVAYMGQFVLAVPGVERWPAQEHALLFDFCRLKGSAREADYARAFQRQHRFFRALRSRADRMNDER